MCGIWGTSRITEVTWAMAPLLSWEMEDRGKDSWGATNGVLTEKHIGPITESWAMPPWERMIIHTRAATHGSAKVEGNAHPFEFRKPNGGLLVGIHNGVVRNHTELNTKYGRDFQVDSMHIFANLASGIPTREIEGYGNIAWYDEGVLNLARFNTDDLVVYTLESGELVFCSTESPIKRAASMCGSRAKTKWKIDPETQYRVEQVDGADGLVEVGPLPFGYRVAVSPHVSHGAHGPYGQGYTPIGGGRVVGGKEVCYICRDADVTKEEFLCKDCLEGVVDDWKKLQEVEKRRVQNPSTKIILPDLPLRVPLGPIQVMGRVD